MTVYEDITEGDRLVLSLLDGSYCNRIFIITGVPTALSFMSAYNSMQAFGVPKPGDRHPGLPDFLCEQVEALNFMNATSKRRIIARYSNFMAVHITVDGNVVREVTKRDRFGKLIRVGYKRVSAAGGKLFQFGEVEALKPHKVIAFQRYIFKQPEVMYEGAVNVSRWNGGGKRAWLCTRHSIAQLRSFENEDIWREITEFEFKGYPITGKVGKGSAAKFENWDTIVYYIDPDTRQPPPDIDEFDPGKKEGNGWVRPELAFEGDFNDLGLPAVFR